MNRFKKIKRLALGVMLCAMVACETERVLYTGPSFVRFSESEQTQRESFSKVIEIPVHLVGEPLDHDITVFYKVGGTAREGVDYQILGENDRAVTIPDGEYFGYIQLQLINNANNIIRSQDIRLTLTGVDDPSIRVGQGRSQMNTTFDFTIFDDCILGGNYTATRTVFSIPTEGITMVSEDCETYLVSNWNIDLFSTPFEMDITFIDNGDNTLTIPRQEEESLPEEWATLEGIGTVDPITREIELTITLIDLEEQPSVTITYKPD